jgi:hypothetical protein
MHNLEHHTSDAHERLRHQLSSKKIDWRRFLPFPPLKYKNSMRASGRSALFVSASVCGCFLPKKRTCNWFAENGQASGLGVEELDKSVATLARLAAEFHAKITVGDATLRKDLFSEVLVAKVGNVNQSALPSALLNENPPFAAKVWPKK